MIRKLLPAVFTVLIGVLFHSCAVKVPSERPAEIEITLPEKLRNPKMEFSAMLWQNKRLILVPQFPDTWDEEIYALHEQDIAAAVNKGTEINAFQTIKLDNIKKIKAKIGATYEGLEAIVILGNAVYFTLETKAANDYCYLIRGTISGNRIVLDHNRLFALPKPKPVHNAGFEAMSYLKTQNKLLVFFEYNKADISPKGYLVDTGFTKPYTTLPIDPLFYRLTDIVPTGPDKFLGVNYHYNASKTEFPDYIGSDTLHREPAMLGKTLKESSFTRLVTLHAGKKITWAPGQTISLKPENWEGIAPYKNGVLMVTDYYPGSLKWFRLKGSN